MPPGPFTSAEPARSGKILLPNMRQVPDVALPLNRLCLNLCGGTVAFSPVTILDRLGHTWRA